MGKTKKITDKNLLNIIIESIKEKKGREIVSINLEKTGSSVCDYFVICNADSVTQVGAIAESVERKVKEGFRIHADHIEGVQNAQWVLIDYANIVVHIFLTEYRTFYALEDLWADGIIQRYEESY
jgi:ribosome-associated protein